MNQRAYKRHHNQHDRSQVIDMNSKGDIHRTKIDPLPTLGDLKICIVSGYRLNQNRNGQKEGQEHGAGR